MAKGWYPVIDYGKCMECGSCVKMCRHGVYDKSKPKSPVVVHLEGCIKGCHGCGNLCPAGAIVYVGDNTGWVPPHGKIEKPDSCGCGSGGCC